MKASELISELQSIIEKDGDLDVYTGDGVEVISAEVDHDIDDFIALETGA
jgi:hypothetical protein